MSTLFECTKIYTDIMTDTIVAYVYSRTIGGETESIILSRDMVVDKKLEGYEYIDYLGEDHQDVLFHRGRVCTIPQYRDDRYIDIEFDRINEDTALLWGYQIRIMDLMEIDSDHSLMLLSRV